MALNDYEFRLDEDGVGVVLNTDLLSVPFVDIERVSGLDSPPFRETMRDHEGTDGGFMDAEFEKGRELALEGTAFCDVDIIEEYLDSLKANFAPSATVKPFYFKSPGVDERLLFVKPRGVRYDWQQARRYGETPIQFLMYAEDPRQYDSELVEVTIPYGGSAGEGLGFSFGFDFGFGPAVLPSGEYVTNSGNRPTPPTFTINGPVENPAIINETAGRTLQFYLSLSASDSLVVNTRDRTVVQNGTANRRGAMSSAQWFDLPVGSTFIRFGAVSGSGNLEVSYRNAWR